MAEHDGAVRSDSENLLRRMDELRSDGIPEFCVQAFRKGWHIGVARGRLSGLLESRGLALTGAQEARLEACEDLDILDFWYRIAATATRVGEVFAD